MKKPTCTDCIIYVMRQENRPMFLHEIQQAIVDRLGAYHSESAISARMRDQVKCQLALDGMTIVGKAPRGKQAWTYWIAKTGDNSCRVFAG